LKGGDGGWEGGSWPNPRKPREKATGDAEAYTPRDEEAIVGMFFFWEKHALRARGRKQGQGRPQLGGQHLHGSLEGLRNLLMVK